MNKLLHDKAALYLFRTFSTIVIVLLLISLLAALSLFVLFVYEPSPLDGFSFSSAGTTIQLPDGRRLAYLETGDPEGRPVLYFHGSPGSRLEGLFFDQFNKQLGVRLIAIDRPGYGLSDFQQNRTYLNWAGDVSEMADQLGIDRFAVLGWSSGGPYATVVAHELPERVTVAAVVAGEGPYASSDYPKSVMNSATFSGSDANKLFIRCTANCRWLMQAIFRMVRIQRFGNPVSPADFGTAIDQSAKDLQFFTRDFLHEYGANQMEAFRQGSGGITRDVILERLDWPFMPEKIHTPAVLVFYGEEERVLHPEIGRYLCRRIPSCKEPTIYPGEGHSVIYYRYEEIVEEMLGAWR